MKKVIVTRLCPGAALVYVSSYAVDELQHGDVVTFLSFVPVTGELFLLAPGGMSRRRFFGRFGGEPATVASAWLTNWFQLCAGEHAEDGSLASRDRDSLDEGAHVVRR